MVRWKWGSVPYAGSWRSSSRTDAFRGLHLFCKCLVVSNNHIFYSIKTFWYTWCFSPPIHTLNTRMKFVRPFWGPLLQYLGRSSFRFSWSKGVAASHAWSIVVRCQVASEFCQCIFIYLYPPVTQEINTLATLFLIFVIYKTTWGEWVFAGLLYEYKMFSWRFVWV